MTTHKTHPPPIKEGAEARLVLCGARTHIRFELLLPFFLFFLHNKIYDPREINILLYEGRDPYHNIRRK